jgi:cell division protease FtsH
VLKNRVVPETTPPSPEDARARRIRFWLIVILPLLVVNFWLVNTATKAPPRQRIPYSPLFLNEIRYGNVAQITSRGTAIQGTFKHRDPNTGRSLRFATEIPEFANRDSLSRLLTKHQVVVNAEPLDEGLVWWKSIVYGFGPTFIFIGLMIWLLRRTRAGGMLGGFGRSRAKRYEQSDSRTTFADVAGIDEAKAELREIVDFLREPDKYQRLGARIPRGVLLSGPPGTGKTLLARAIAGEAGAPFFSMSASEFVEAIAGIGASRVRDLFSQAKAVAPSIVFIDELDAVGRARGASAGFSGNDEREQTLNQILTEMDGFDPTTTVIVVAATNRPDILDSALLRAGRFDRRVPVQAPDRNGRRMILEVHTRHVPLDPEVDLERLAAMTAGMVGADLANLVNEAALIAATAGQSSVTFADLTNALEKVVLGTERQLVLRPEDRLRTAYHEAGHALVGMLVEGADPVRKVSIIPRGVALGVTLAASEIDRFNYSERDLLARIEFALGGRVAEELVFGDLTTGAEGDIKQITEIARHMVARWGMSRQVGMVALPEGGSVGDYVPSERMREAFDAEVQRIIADAYARVEELLRENRSSLDSLVQALLEQETLDETAAYAAAGMPAPAAPASA